MTNIVVEPDINVNDEQEQQGEEGEDNECNVQTIKKLTSSDVQSNALNAQILSCKSTLTTLDSQILALRSVRTICYTLQMIFCITLQKYFLYIEKPR